MEKLYGGVIELLKKCENIYDDKKRIVAAGILCENGKIYYGINIDWWSSVCAESVALANALKDGQQKFVCCLAVKFDEQGNLRIVSPCGRCREMFYQLNIDINFVIAKNGDKFQIVSLNELLPHKYRK